MISLRDMEVRNQKPENGAGVGVEQLADLLEECREPAGITVVEVVCQDQIVATGFAKQ